MSKIVKNPAMVLQELTVKKNLGPPNYEIYSSISGTHENRFDYRVKVAGVEAIGTGSSKQISKHDAAYKALKQLEQIGIYDPKEIPMEEFKASVVQKSVSLGPDSPKLSLHCVGPLKDLCLDQKIEDPIFNELSDAGPPHCREFTYECVIGSIKTVATGNTKKMAKQLAAKDMLEKLKTILPELKVEVPRRTEQLKTLAPSERDGKVLEIYNKTFGHVVADKKIKVKHFSTVFNKLMTEYDITKDNLRTELDQQTEDALERMLQKIGLKHDTYLLQESPFIMALNINCDVPFAAMAIGETEEKAKAEVIHTTFEMLNCFIK